MKRCAPLFLIFILSALPLLAQIKLPAIISDNMVLQQQSEAVLWGWAKRGEKISIITSWNKKSVTTTAGEEGKWSARIRTGKAGGPYTITFAASDSIEVKNVLLGEVWLASGQSNMEFFVGKGPGWKTGIINYEQEIPRANYPQIRMIDVENKAADKEQADFKGSWVICSPQTVADMSAVAYFFSKEIQQSTGFPVGIINSTWGGTLAESWTKKEVLEKDPGFQTILTRYQQQLNDYPAAYIRYKEDFEKWKTDTSSKKKAAPKNPLAYDWSIAPAKLYNGMIAPLIPYTLKGVIWYQGESNARRGFQYRRLFPALIESWRNDWKDPELPFYFVQISPHQDQNPDIRDAQLFTYRTVSHTGIVVTTDNGDSIDIHPRNKELVGKRLSLWALHNEYGKKSIIVSGPLYKSMETVGDKIRIQFDFAEGLTAKGGILEEFTIAGSDQQFRPARAVIEGSSVIVSSEEVKQPVAVRFAWRNVPHADLYNKAGLPASPFRTDNWKLETEGKN